MISEQKSLSAEISMLIMSSLRSVAAMITISASTAQMAQREFLLQLKVPEPESQCSAQQHFLHSSSIQVISLMQRAEKTALPMKREKVSALRHSYIRIASIMKNSRILFLDPSVSTIPLRYIGLFKFYG